MRKSKSMLSALLMFSGHVDDIVAKHSMDLMGFNHPENSLMKMVDETREPLRIEDGTTDAFLLQDAMGKPVGVFKGTVEQDKTNYLYERVAFLLDNGRGNVPETEIITFHKGDEIVQGSLQKFIPDTLGSADDFGPGVFETDNVHEIGILDIRLLNNDRHTGNLLVVNQPDGKTKKLIAIDHANSLPRINSPDLGANWDWLYFPQASQPFSERTLKYIESIDLEKDLSMMKDLGVPLASLLTVFLTTLILKRGAKMGLTLKQIASIVHRQGDRSLPCPLELIVAKASEDEEVFFSTFNEQVDVVLHNVKSGVLALTE